MKYIILNTLACFCMLFDLSAQNSFSRVLNFQELNWEDGEIFIPLQNTLTIAKSGEIYIAGYVTGFLDEFESEGGSILALVQLDEEGNIIKFVLFSVAGETFTTYLGQLEIRDSFFSLNYQDLGVSGKNFIFSGNLNTEVYWSRTTADTVRYVGGTTFLGDKIFYSQVNDNFNSEDTKSRDIRVIATDIETGASFWGKKFKLLNSNQRYYITYNYWNKENQLVSILGRASTNFDDIVFVNQVNEDGVMEQSYGINDSNLGAFIHRYDSQGNLIIAGRYGSISTADGFIAKYNEQFEQIWAKKVEADFFVCFDLSIEIQDNDDIVFSYAAFGDFPSISGVINKDGVLQNYWGYAAIGPNVTSGPDNSLYMITSVFSDSESEYHNDPLLVKTNPDGTIDNCPEYDACLELTDFDLPLEPLEWESEDVDPMPMAEVLSTNLDLTAEDFCYEPPFPTPDFLLPDTICISTCLQPEGLNNQLANHAQFNIRGPELDSLIEDLTFTYCFEEEGTYVIEQEIWVLGCAYVFERSVTVIPELELNLPEDALLCDELPYELLPTFNRQPIDFLWSTGSTDSTILINTEGNYALTISDGYCQSMDSVTLDFVRLQIPEDWVLIPDDTLICPLDFPYRLEVSSPYVDAFDIPELGQSGSVFDLTQPGSYTLLATIDNCPFETTFNLAFDPCIRDLFIPNAFSPNGDGINDHFEVYGPDIEVLSLQVFDRWGATIFETNTSPYRWDGVNGERAAAPGVYVVLIRYLNTLTGEEFQASSDLTVVY